jgi:uncharacterized integral membrane protein (TIGR00697 family)
MIAWLLVTVVIAGATAVTARWFGKEVVIGLYVGSIVTSIVVAGKLGVVPGFEDLSLSASIWVYSATFIFTDVIAEIWGKKTARKAIYAGALMYPLLFATTQFSIEWQPHPSWAENQAAYATTMGTTVRIVIASFSAFVASQLHDVWAFHFWKEKTGGKYLWLRNNASTWTSQLIDTVVFYTVGFYGVFPVLPLIGVTYLAKIAIAALDTPIVYGVVWAVRGSIESPDEVEEIAAPT